MLAMVAALALGMGTTGTAAATGEFKVNGETVLTDPETNKCRCSYFVHLTRYVV
ncbi:hypothetical protein [Saccharopolyspora hattusasensis]|uniref:hypothetical protein n=1 Tax=Saccharopolyspora hattusasensis TaxID=1128679 RepID=UPI003D973C5B